MSKRAPQFKRRAADAYDTPPEAVDPLLAHLPSGCRFWEPCAGAFALGTALMDAGLHCDFASDITPRAGGVYEMDALSVTKTQLMVCHRRIDLIITNPPWTRQILHPMIDLFRSLIPTWLLFDADWMHCKQAIPYLPYCHKIVSVGRVKWIPDSPHTGKDNAAWHLFDRDPAPTVFYGRQV